MATPKTYAWRDLHFEPKIKNNGDIRTADNLEAIRQSIVSILTTKRGERVMLPTFGSNIWELLFEPMDEITVDRIRDAVDVSIRKWEPRVEVGNVKVVANEDNNKYDISIAYSIKGYTVSGIQVLNIDLKRG